MSDGTPVRCLDCGHEWETVADYPQCSDPDDECGRSRNVEPIAELEGEQSGEHPHAGMSERDPAPSGDSHEQSGQDSDWSPLFDAQESETEPVEDMSMSEAPEIEGMADPEAGPDETADPTESADVDLPELEPEDIELFVKTPFDMAAKSRGEHWELGDDELTQLSHAYARVGNKYAPYVMKEHAPEAMAAITTVAVVGPRVAEDKAQEKEQEKAEKDTEARDETDRSSNRVAQNQNNQQDGFAYDSL